MGFGGLWMGLPFDYCFAASITTQIQLRRAKVQINGSSCYFGAGSELYCLRSPQGSSWMVYGVIVAVGGKGMAWPGWKQMTIMVV